MLLKKDRSDVCHQLEYNRSYRIRFIQKVFGKGRSRSNRFRLDNPSSLGPIAFLLSSPFITTTLAQLCARIHRVLAEPADMDLAVVDMFDTFYPEC